MVEFAIVALLFFSLLLGIMDFGRLLFTWNAAAEATRWAAALTTLKLEAEGPVRGTGADVTALLRDRYA